MKRNLLEKAHIDKAKYTMGLRTAILLMIYAVLNLIFQDFEHYVLLGLATANISVYIIKAIWKNHNQSEADLLFAKLESFELKLLADNIHGEPFKASELDVKDLILKELVIIKKKIRDNNGKITDYICVIDPEYVAPLSNYLRKGRN